MKFVINDFMFASVLTYTHYYIVLNANFQAKNDRVGGRQICVDKEEDMWAMVAYTHK